VSLEVAAAVSLSAARQAPAPAFDADDPFGDLLGGAAPAATSVRAIASSLGVPDARGQPGAGSAAAAVDIFAQGRHRIAPRRGPLLDYPPTATKAASPPARQAPAAAQKPKASADPFADLL
jgi:hypothetical protein